MYPRQFKLGFTLMELLVVISIISLLSSVVLASLSQSRDKAKIAAGTIELNQVKTAITSYLLDHGDYPPMLQPVISPGPSSTVDLVYTLFPDLIYNKYLSAQPQYLNGYYIHRCSGDSICDTSKNISSDFYLQLICGFNRTADAAITFNVYSKELLPNYPNKTIKSNGELGWITDYNILCLFKD